MSDIPTPITLADEVVAMVHAFSDADRRERVRALARQVADLERQLVEANKRIEELTHALRGSQNGQDDLSHALKIAQREAERKEQES